MSDYAEVHSVAITLNKHRIKGREIYGMVNAEDECGTLEIFKESKESCKPIFADDTLYLTGPARPISCTGLAFFVNLKDKHTDLEVSNGFHFVPFLSESRFNKPMSLAFTGDYGTATLHATMFGSSLEVTVKVKLVIDPNFLPNKRAKMSGFGDNSKKSIHGTLYAQVSGEERLCLRRTLFNRPADDPQHLNEDEIPLARYLIVVPKFSSFMIKANLWDGTQVKVADGTASFDDPNTSMYPAFFEQVSEIKGEEGVCIKVEVTWHEERCYWTAPAPPVVVDEMK